MSERLLFCIVLISLKKALIMNIVTRIRLIKHRLVGPNLRSISTTPSLQQARALVKLKKQQADFQCDDGKPIWLKGGFSDRILYTSNLIGCAVGFIMCLLVFYDHAKPPSWRTGSTTC